MESIMSTNQGDAEGGAKMEKEVQQLIPFVYLSFNEYALCMEGRQKNANKLN